MTWRRREGKRRVEHDKVRAGVERKIEGMESTVRGRQNRKQQSEQAEKNQAENGRERLRKIDEGKARAAQGRIEKVHRTENKIFRQNRSW